MSDQWCPANCATTLQEGMKWFWEPGAKIKPLAELVQVYHDTVGRNCVLELDFAINRDGRVDPRHAERYREFGQWIHSCYGQPFASAYTHGGWNVTLMTNPSI